MCVHCRLGAFQSFTCIPSAILPHVLAVVFNKLLDINWFTIQQWSYSSNHITVKYYGKKKCCLLEKNLCMHVCCLLVLLGTKLHTDWLYMFVFAWVLTGSLFYPVFRFERERTCPLCRVLVKAADIKSYSDGSTNLSVQLF